MASKQSTVDFILKQASGAGEMHAKKMFGEYGIYCDGKIVALICDDELYLKPTEAGEKFIGEVKEGCPYPGSKPYFLVPRDQWNDSAWLSCLIKLSAAELPTPKKKETHRKLI